MYYFLLTLVILPNLWVICVGESAPAPWNTSGLTGQVRALYRNSRSFFRVLYVMLGLVLLPLFWWGS